MKQFNVLLQKEWREIIRSRKLIWLPLVFLSLGVSDPLANYFMEDIMSSVGNMPDGMQIIMPELEPVDLLIASTGQFQSIGLVVLIAIFAGAISRERQNGTATLLYVRPLSFAALFMSKFTVATLVGIISILAGYAGSMYYTALLYGTVNWGGFAAMLATYVLWICFVMAVTLAMSALFSTMVAVASAIIFVPIAMLIDSLIGSYWTVTPWKLATYGVQLIDGGVNHSDLIWTIIVTALLTILLVCVGIFATKKNAYKTQI